MSSLRILMYCNDSRGLGQTTRTLNIAASLSKALEEASILVLTDLSTVGRFRLAEHVDYVHLPVLETNGHAGFSFGGLNIDYENKLRIRRKIAHSAIKTFRPELVILDESLFNHPEEMQRLVEYVRDEAPAAKMVWSLSDTLGEPDLVMRQWARNGVYEAFERFADEIFVFGAAPIFNLAESYQMPAPIARKIFYTGYLAHLGMPSRRVCENLAKLNRNLPFVLLSAGGSSGDRRLIDEYLRVLEKYADGLAVQSMIIAGPFIGSEEKHRLAQRAKKLPHVTFHRFGKHTLQYVRYADLVLYSGDYNLTAEILAHRKAALAVPNAKEQPANFCRARLLHDLGLLKRVPPEDYHPALLREEIGKAIGGAPRLARKARYEDIPLDGLAKIAGRIRQLCGLAPPAKLKVAS
jgi:predicted glycosyltransferase